MPDAIVPGTHGDGHPATVGELDRIADQVVEDLLHTERIADIGTTRRRIVVEVDVEALFLGAHLHQLDHIADHLGQVELDAFDLDNALIDLGEVEQVIDQDQ